MEVMKIFYLTKGRDTLINPRVMGDLLTRVSPCRLLGWSAVNEVNSFTGRMIGILNKNASDSKSVYRL